MANHILYVGTYTSASQSEGIYSVRLGPNKDEILQQQVQSRCCNPAFLAVEPSRQLLYAVDDSPDQGGLYAYRYDPATGALTYLNERRLSGAAGSCHLAFSKDGRFVLASCYYSGNVFVCRVEPDGRVGEVVCSVQHQGSGPVPRHQDSAHAHCVVFDKSGERLVVAELGADRLNLYRFDPATGQLTPNPAQPEVPLPPGQGPRHAAYGPGEKQLYVVTELGNRIYVYACGEEEFTLAETQWVSTLPDGFTGRSTAGEILVTPEGGHVFATNRWYDSIVGFARAQGTGALGERTFYSCLGGEPRHFALSPEGDCLAVANQDTHNVVLFDFDMHRGRIGDKRFEFPIPKPAFVQWMRQEGP